MFVNLYKRGWATPRGLGSMSFFIFRELGSTGNYFKGSGVQVYSLRDLGSTARK